MSPAPAHVVAQSRRSGGIPNAARTSSMKWRVVTGQTRLYPIG